MPRSRARAAGPALGVSALIAAGLVAARIAGSEALSHEAAAIVLVLALPWVVPAFVALAVASAPLYFALHVLGHPVELAPWLSAVILIAGVAGCHVNAVLLFGRLLREPLGRPEIGLAEFLRRSGARVP